MCPALLEALGISSEQGHWREENHFRCFVAKQISLVFHLGRLVIWAVDHL